MLPAALYNAGPQFVRHFLCGKGSQKTRHCHSFAVNFFYHAAAHNIGKNSIIIKILVSCRDTFGCHTYMALLDILDFDTE